MAILAEKKIASKVSIAAMKQQKLLHTSEAAQRVQNRRNSKAYARANVEFEPLNME